MGRRLRALGRLLGIILLPIILLLLTIPLMIGYLIVLLLSIAGWVIGFVDMLIELVLGRPSHMGEGIQRYAFRVFDTINERIKRIVWWFWTGEISLTG